MTERGAHSTILRLGLSYTSFSYRDLTVEAEGVRFFVKNSGARDGAEIAQLYISALESEVFRPEKELKGFAKVFLKAGEEKEVFIPFDDKSFRVYDSARGCFIEEEGRYRILVGASAADLRLAAETERGGERMLIPQEKKAPAPLFQRGGRNKSGERNLSACSGEKPSARRSQGNCFAAMRSMNSGVRAVCSRGSFTAAYSARSTRARQSVSRI